MKHYKVDIKQYVSFDQKTGQILSIGPSYNEGTSYIEVLDKEVEPIKTLKEKYNCLNLHHSKGLKESAI